MYFNSSIVEYVFNCCPESNVIKPVLWSKLLHVIKPFSLHQRQTLSLSMISQRTIFDRIKNQFLQKSEVCRLAGHSHKGLVKIVAQALSLPGAHVVAG
jgi:hypothetical protein